ncbi:MAG: CAAD domain-containing protein [Stenomitos rutilans HA7619-LM2]|nr:CAAD domain-containing protein [Stenomitos rutilans HA7619-LM2]
MNPDVKETEFPDTSPSDFAPETNLSLEEPPLLPPASETETETSQQLKQVADRIYAFLSGLPDYLSDFFGEYRRPIITLGLIFGSIVSVKLTLALLGAINDIPLLAPTFELIGFAYTAWFIYRYLWRASNREELAASFGSLRDQVLGRGTPKI